MIRIAIVEDEPLYTKQLQEHLERYQIETGIMLKITRYTDGDEIAEGYTGKLDVIFMDIQMQFMNGMEAAVNIRKKDKEVIIIFITNMVQYAIQGYQVGAMDYMVKPVSYFALSQKLDRIRDKLKKREQKFIAIPVGSGVQKLDISGIYYVESQNHDLVYVTKEGRFSSRGTMRQLEEVLIPYCFFRSSKSFLVNMQYVEGIRDNYCIVQKEKITVGRSKRKAFMDAFVGYMSEVMG